MNLFAQVITWINIPVNAIGKVLFAPIAVLPGWLSNGIISAIVGVIALVIFKYTSNQSTIGRIKNDIKAHMLALKLFKDSISVTFKAQGRVFRGAFLILFHSMRPMLVMLIPLSLVFFQMWLWYQHRPLAKGEETIIKVEINGNIQDLSKVHIEPSEAVNVVIGPVKVLSKSEIYWKIKALENGYHDILFNVGNQNMTKQVAVGDGFMRLSSKRPGWKWSEILEHPAEEPLGLRSQVKSISIDYPKRLSLTSGTNWWIVYFFVVSFIFFFIFKPFLKVKI